MRFNSAFKGLIIGATVTFGGLFKRAKRSWRGNVTVRQEYWVSFSALVILHFRMFYERVRAPNDVTPVTS